jgi:hypothetical protein
LIEPIIPSEPSARDILLLSTADVDQNTTNNTNTDKKKLESVSLFSTEIVESKGPKLLLSKRRFEDIESLTPPVLVDSSPITFQTPKEKPAYKRFAHLISKTTLELPLELQNLIKIFVALESVLNYLKSRDTIAIFHKIQQSVQNQAGVNFELKHLAQIVYIYPEAYKLSSVNVLVRDKRVPSLSIEFMNDVLKEEFVKNLDRASQPLQTGSKISTISSASSNKDMMTAVTEFVKQIPIRRQKMEELLIEHVKKEHQVIFVNVVIFRKEWVDLGVFDSQAKLASAI